MKDIYGRDIRAKETYTRREVTNIRRGHTHGKDIHKKEDIHMS